MNEITSLSEYEAALKRMEMLLPSIDNDISIDDADLAELEHISRQVSDFEQKNSH